MLRSFCWRSSQAMARARKRQSLPRTRGGSGGEAPATAQCLADQPVEDPLPEVPRVDHPVGLSGSEVHNVRATDSTSRIRRPSTWQGSPVPFGERGFHLAPQPRTCEGTSATASSFCGAWRPRSSGSPRLRAPGVSESGALPRRRRPPRAYAEDPGRPRKFSIIMRSQGANSSACPVLRTVTGCPARVSVNLRESCATRSHF